MDISIDEVRTKKRQLRVSIEIEMKISPFFNPCPRRSRGICRLDPCARWKLVTYSFCPAPLNPRFPTPLFLDHMSQLWKRYLCIFSPVGGAHPLILVLIPIPTSFLFLFVSVIHPLLIFCNHATPDLPSLSLSPSSSPSFVPVSSCLDLRALKFLPCTHILPPLATHDICVAVRSCCCKPGVTFVSRTNVKSTFLKNGLERWSCQKQTSRTRPLP